MPNNGPDYSKLPPLDAPGALERAGRQYAYWEGEQITPDFKKDMLASGVYTPEAVDMIERLVQSGMSFNLATVAVNDFMGINKDAGKSKEQAAWDAYTREHPYAAATKKLLVKGSEPLRDLGRAVAKPFNPQSQAEKLSAAKMLEEYLMAKDRERANEQMKNGLWMVARMPGAPLAGQPVYMGGPDPVQPPTAATFTAPAQPTIPASNVPPAPYPVARMQGPRGR